jgi:hypothetical protein
MNNLQTLDATLARLENMTGIKTMTTTPERVNVYDEAGELRGTIYGLEDAAMFAAFVGHGAEVRSGAGRLARVLWREGFEFQSAAESYDAAAELMCKRFEKPM